MARALCIERPGGRCRVAARGNERKAIYYCDSDREHFLQLLAEATQRINALGLHLNLQHCVIGIGGRTRRGCLSRLDIAVLFTSKSDLLQD